MQCYKESDILKIAKRINNNKRPYLLVNPLQAKHIPVSPSEAMEMMTSLGKLVAEKYSEARLVIGFAETATAIGAVVAKTISDECYYIHTTRENVRNAKEYAFFSEEHSHATEQKLVSDDLEKMLSKTETVILVDDEFSTGKTLINMVNRLRNDYLVLAEKKIVAASIINRLSEANIQRWHNEKIESVCLLKLPETDYSDYVNPIAVTAAAIPIGKDIDSTTKMTIIKQNFPDPRNGVNVSHYYESCISKVALIQKRTDLRDKNVLILGTEECMLPALLIGKEIENEKEVSSVKCHATTRSPIGICNVQGYPIRSGFSIPSFYDSNRNTFIYNLQQYDVVIIVSDTTASYEQALYELSAILKELGCKEIICLVGENDV